MSKLVALLVSALCAVSMNAFAVPKTPKPLKVSFGIINKLIMSEKRRCGLFCKNFIKKFSIGKFNHGFYHDGDCH